MSERTSTRARRYRRIALAGGLAVFGAMLVPGPASALPVGAPRIGMVCTPGTVSGSTHTFNLVAKTGYIDTPDGNSIFMWSYANADAPDSGHFQSPGPVLCVTPEAAAWPNLSAIRPGWPEARAAQSRYLWMCTEERARCGPAEEARRVV